MSNDKLRELSRKEVLDLIKANGGPAGLDLSQANLMGFDLSGLNLSGANFNGSLLHRASLQQCNLADASLREANCSEADFSNASLIRADLTKAYCREADFTGVSFYRAILNETVFNRANLRGASLFNARLVGTKLSRKSLGSSLVQDSEAQLETFYKRFLSETVYEKRIERYLEQRLKEGEDIYRALKKLFLDNGQYADASWAYVCERRVRRQAHHPRYARQYFGGELPVEGRFRALHLGWFYLRHLYSWLLEWLGELSCGYGEKPFRTLGWAALVLIIFPWLYRLSGGIGKTSGSMSWLDYFNYSLGAFTTTGFDVFEVKTSLAQTLTSIEALLGVGLLALLLFALGNRINRA